MVTNRTWCNVELPREDAELFKRYLRKHNIKFEPSEAYSLIHFECLMTEEEFDAANDWIDQIL